MCLISKRLVDESFCPFGILYYSILQLPLILGYHVTQSHGIDDHDITQFEWMLLNEDKSFALSKNKLQLAT
jgi:hypothetical protein